MNELILGSCEQALALEAGSIDLIVTDPPYVKEVWKDAYTLLNRIAVHILRPSGFLCTYAPHYVLPDVIRILNRKMIWYWLMIQRNRAPRPRIWDRNFTATYKPILVFQKAPKKKQEYFASDILPQGYMEKKFHKWQQSIHEALYLILVYSKESEKVLDPFMGSGTVPLAAKLMNRSYLGYEIDEKAFNTAVMRVCQTGLSTEWFGDQLQVAKRDTIPPFQKTTQEKL